MGQDQPSTPAIPADPNLALEQANAEADLEAQTRIESQGDMARLMAIYGSRLALAPTATSRPV
jgi:hypothetical protein